MFRVAWQVHECLDSHLYTGLHMHTQFQQHLKDLQPSTQPPPSQKLNFLGMQQRARSYWPAMPVEWLYQPSSNSFVAAAVPSLLEALECLQLSIHAPLAK